MSEAQLSTSGDTRFEAAPKRTRAKRSGFHRQPGARTMKEYPLTSTEMWTLAGLGLAATLAFSFGSFFLSTWFDIYKDLTAPPPEMTAEVLGLWKGLRFASGVAASICFGFGILFTAINGMAVKGIMDATEHPE